MGKTFRVHLSKHYQEFIESLPEGFQKYIRNKIDKDIAELPTSKECREHIDSWKSKFKLALKREKK